MAENQQLIPCQFCKTVPQLIPSSRLLAHIAAHLGYRPHRCTEFGCKYGCYILDDFTEHMKATGHRHIALEAEHNDHLESLCKATFDDCFRKNFRQQLALLEKKEPIEDPLVIDLTAASPSPLPPHASSQEPPHDLSPAPPPYDFSQREPPQIPLPDPAVLWPLQAPDSVTSTTALPEPTTPTSNTGFGENDHLFEQLGTSLNLNPHLMPPTNDISSNVKQSPTSPTKEAGTSTSADMQLSEFDQECQLEQKYELTKQREEEEKAMQKKKAAEKQTKKKRGGKAKSNEGKQKPKLNVTSNKMIVKKSGAKPNSGRNVQNSKKNPGKKPNDGGKVQNSKKKPGKKPNDGGKEQNSNKKKPGKKPNGDGEEKQHVKKGPKSGGKAQNENLSSEPKKTVGRKQKSAQLKSTTPVRGRRSESPSVLHCICKTPYDPTKFYLQCAKCELWFHGNCVRVKQKDIKHMDFWLCGSCNPEEIEELFCVCQQPIDSSVYVGCEQCGGWFHPECVHTTEEKIRALGDTPFFCPPCKKWKIKNVKGTIKKEVNE